MESRTKDLLQSLYGNQKISCILEQNRDEFIARPLCQALAELLEQKGITRAQAIRNAMMNSIYGQQIFAGTKTPSRDKLLTTAFGMGLDFEQTDTLLKRQGYPRLYPRHQRDAIIIYGLLHRLSLLDTNTLLYENDLQTLL